MRTIDLNDDRAGYDDRLHIDDDALPDGVESFPEEVMDFIERRVREMNGNDQDKLLCGGCIFGMIEALSKVTLQRGDATLHDARGWAGRMRYQFGKMEDAANVGIQEEGPDAKVYEPGQKLKVVGRRAPPDESVIDKLKGLFSRT